MQRPCTNTHLFAELPNAASSPNGLSSPKDGVAAAAVTAETGFAATTTVIGLAEIATAAAAGTGAATTALIVAAVAAVPVAVTMGAVTVAAAAAEEVGAEPAPLLRSSVVCAVTCARRARRRVCV
jgi:hypothetical protein